MSVLYMSKHGAVLRIKGDRLIVCHGRESLLETPGIKVDQVVIFGNGVLTPQSMGYLLKNNIDVAFISMSGRYLGRLQPPLSQHVILRKAQYEKASDLDFCLAFSKQVITTKIRNSLTLLEKRGGAEATKNRSRLRSAIKKLSEAGDSGRVRGIEGTASAAYFDAFRGHMKNTMGFSKRIKHPPPDPVNILLSLGYTLLSNFVHSMINVAGMDPFQGFFHQQKFGHAALASDLVEPMRAPVVDTLVLRVINLKIITDKDFCREDGRVSFQKQALKRFLEEYDKKLESTRYFPPAKKHLNYKQIIEWQCRRLARVLRGDEKDPAPYIWKRR